MTAQAQGIKSSPAPFFDWESPPEGGPNGKNRRYFTEQGIKYIWTKNAEPSIIMGIDIGKGDK